MFPKIKQAKHLYSLNSTSPPIGKVNKLLCILKLQNLWLAYHDYNGDMNIACLQILSTFVVIKKTKQKKRVSSMLTTGHVTSPKGLCTYLWTHSYIYIYTHTPAVVCVCYSYHILYVFILFCGSLHKHQDSSDFVNWKYFDIWNYIFLKIHLLKKLVCLLKSQEYNFISFRENISLLKVKC